MIRDYGYPRGSTGVETNVAVIMMIGMFLGTMAKSSSISWKTQIDLES
jgi:hypothetical protein